MHGERGVVKADVVDVLDGHGVKIGIFEVTGGATFSRNTVRITDYIDRKYSDDISLSFLSEYFGLSRSFIARLFKNELRTTTTEHLNCTRIAASCRMLIFSDMKIGEISEAVGFKDQYYFSRVFKKLRGMTPGEFRKVGRRV